MKCKTNLRSYFNYAAILEELIFLQVLDMFKKNKAWMRYNKRKITNLKCIFINMLNYTIPYFNIIEGSSFKILYVPGKVRKCRQKIKIKVTVLKLNEDNERYMFKSRIFCNEKFYADKAEVFACYKASAEFPITSKKITYFCVISFVWRTVTKINKLIF